MSDGQQEVVPSSLSQTYEKSLENYAASLVPGLPTTPTFSSNGRSLSYPHVQVKAPVFKGSMEDFANITNFKRFKRKGSSSKYKGVFFVKKEKKFRAQICLKGKKKYVGTFKNDFDAAVARDAMIREMFGEVVELLNFPKKSTTPETTPEPQPQLPQLNPTLAAQQASTQSARFQGMKSRLSTLSRYGSSACSTSSFGVGFPLDNYNYNPLINLNLQEIAIPRRTMLAKRFSSGESFSFLHNVHQNFQSEAHSSAHISTGKSLQQPMPQNTASKVLHLHNVNNSNVTEPDPKRIKTSN